MHLPHYLGNTGEVNPGGVVGVNVVFIRAVKYNAIACCDKFGASTIHNNIFFGI